MPPLRLMQPCFRNPTSGNVETPGVVEDLLLTQRSTVVFALALRIQSESVPNLDAWGLGVGALSRATIDQNGEYGTILKRACRRAAEVNFKISPFCVILVPLALIFGTSW